jgi:hypothetical protein
MTRARIAKLISGSVLVALPFAYVAFLNLPFDIQFAIVGVVMGTIGVSVGAVSLILGGRMIYQAFKG